MVAYVCALNAIKETFSYLSGLTYWKLEEGELYRPLPDSIENSSFLLMQDVNLSQVNMERDPHPINPCMIFYCNVVLLRRSIYFYFLNDIFFFTLV